MVWHVACGLWSVQVAPEAWIQMFLLAGTFEAMEYKHKLSGSTKPFWDPMNLMPKVNSTPLLFTNTPFSLPTPPPL